MPRGGARNRSGPPKDPKSARSERAGYSVTALPANGFDGEPPTWPLMMRQVLRWENDEDGRRTQVCDDGATEDIKERELELWAWAWTTPQACAWSMPSEAWRLHTIALWVRTFVLCESSDATAADKNSLHRLADQIGMTPAGLRENGWQIKVDELSKKAAEKSTQTAPVKRERRLRAT